MEKWERLEKAYTPRQMPDAVREDIGANEMWMNNLYTVFVRRGREDGGVKYTWLSIRRNDRAPAHDWRHFQYIKNQLVGPENEAVEIYPAESRLVDGSNQYHLWVFEDTNVFMPFGFTERTISEHPLPGGKQRAFPVNMKPVDLKEMELKVKESLKQFNQVNNTDF